MQNKGALPMGIITVMSNDPHLLSVSRKTIVENDFYIIEISRRNDFANLADEMLDGDGIIADIASFPDHVEALATMLNTDQWRRPFTMLQQSDFEPSDVLKVLAKINYWTSIAPKEKFNCELKRIIRQVNSLKSR